MRAKIIVFIVRASLIVCLPFVVAIELVKTLWTETRFIPWYLWNSVRQDWDGFMRAWRSVPEEIAKWKNAKTERTK